MCAPVWNNDFSYQNLGVSRFHHRHNLLEDMDAFFVIVIVQDMVEKVSLRSLEDVSSTINKSPLLHTFHRLRGVEVMAHGFHTLDFDFGNQIRQVLTDETTLKLWVSSLEFRKIMAFSAPHIDN